MPIETIIEFEKEYGIEILEGYGLTEATFATSIHRPSGKRKIGSVGPVLEGQEVGIIDPEGVLMKATEAAPQWTVRA